MHHRHRAKFDADNFNSLRGIAACEGQTDRQTDRNTHTHSTGRHTHARTHARAHTHTAW